MEYHGRRRLASKNILIDTRFVLKHFCDQTNQDHLETVVNYLFKCSQTDMNHIRPLCMIAKHQFNNLPKSYIIYAFKKMRKGCKGRKKIENFRKFYNDDKKCSKSIM